MELVYYSIFFQNVNTFFQGENLVSLGGEMFGEFRFVEVLQRTHGGASKGFPRGLLQSAAKQILMIASGNHTIIYSCHNNRPFGTDCYG